MNSKDYYNADKKKLIIYHFDVCFVFLIIIKNAFRVHKTWQKATLHWQAALQSHQIIKYTVTVLCTPQVYRTYAKLN